MNVLALLALTSIAARLPEFDQPCLFRARRGVCTRIKQCQKVALPQLSTRTAADISQSRKLGKLLEPKTAEERLSRIRSKNLRPLMLGAGYFHVRLIIIRKHRSQLRSIASRSGNLG